MKQAFNAEEDWRVVQNHENKNNVRPFGTLLCKL